MGIDIIKNWEISIHALREEGDNSRHNGKTRTIYFYPRPPRGGRQIPSKMFSFASSFLSTPSARRATYRQTT